MLVRVRHFPVSHQPTGKYLDLARRRMPTKLKFALKYFSLRANSRGFARCLLFFLSVLAHRKRNRADKAPSLGKFPTPSSSPIFCTYRRRPHPSFRRGWPPPRRPPVPPPCSTAFLLRSPPPPAISTDLHHHRPADSSTSAPNFNLRPPPPPPLPLSAGAATSLLLRPTPPSPAPTSVRKRRPHHFPELHRRHLAAQLLCASASPSPVPFSDRHLSSPHLVLPLQLQPRSVSCLSFRRP
jgi:hypothetical protein